MGSSTIEDCRDMLINELKGKQLSSLTPHYMEFQDVLSGFKLTHARRGIGICRVPRSTNQGLVAANCTGPIIQTKEDSKF